MAWVTADEEHYVELLTTSAGIWAACDCGEVSEQSWSSTAPTLWASAHTQQAVTTGECDAARHGACPWYVWDDAPSPRFCACDCHGAVAA